MFTGLFVQFINYNVEVDKELFRKLYKQFLFA